MIMNRRHILFAGAAFGLVGTRSWGVTEASFDGFTIQSVSDGHLLLPRAAVVPAGADPAITGPILEAAAVTGDSIEAPLNLTLLRDGENLVLFDAGSGPDFMPTAGKLLDGLAAIDVAPEDITHVVFTHAHPDHIWGVLDEFDEPLFANAAHLIGRAERDYWIDPATMESIGPDRQSFAAGAARRIEALGEALATFEPDDEILPGIIARATPGHTPGHTSFLLHDAAMVLGDAIVNAHLAFRRPDLAAPNDQDAALGAQTRQALLADLAQSGHVIIGYHLPDGGIGRVMTEGDAYRFQPGG